MSWQDALFKDFRLYTVTDLKAESAAALRSIDAAYRGGADIVQLRSKNLKDAAMLRMGLAVRKIATKHKKLFFMNDRVDLALATGADGVHLGQEDLPIAAARAMARKLGRKLRIGKSTHRLEQALAAVREGADYIGVGPVFATPTKPHAGPVGLKFVKQAARRVRIPWVAIGGIDLKNLAEVMGAGATRVAVVRAVFAAQDPALAAHQIKKLLLCNLESSPF